MRSRLAAVAAMLAVTAAGAIVGAAPANADTGQVTAATVAPAAQQYCPYTVSATTYLRSGPGTGFAKVATWTPGNVYYVASPLQTSGGWILRAPTGSPQWIPPGSIHRYNGLCAE